MPIKPNFPNLRPKVVRQIPTITSPINTPGIGRSRRIITQPNPALRIVIQTLQTDADAVFQGGATLGAAYVGSLTLLEQAGVNFKRIAGNSAGAITAGMVAAGYRAAEIEWLMSNFPNTRLSKPTTLPTTASPIDFMDFLDFPNLSNINQASKRETLLWKLLKGEIIDAILATTIPFPTRRATVDAAIGEMKKNSILNAVLRTPGAEAAMKSVLTTALFFLPTSQPKLDDFNPFKTAALRTAFADRVWDEIARRNPIMRIETQLLYEGSLFEGQAFLNTMNRLLRAKINGTGDVTFNELPIPLAVIAFNYATGKVIVYSSQTHPRMSVAEAVRRSMSLPIVFQPRKVNTNNRGTAESETIIDGGVGSNFPIWLFNDAGNQYWPPSSIDPNRVKIGLSLNETLDVPRSWSVNDAKFNLGANGSVDLMSVVGPVITAKLKDLGIIVPNVTSSESDILAQLNKIKALEVALGFISTDKEEAAREQLITSIMAGKKYFDIVIPLLGFHGFDFSVNGDRDDLDAMAERGYFAALDALSKPPIGSVGTPVIPVPTAFTNPFS
jgi:predicted acylesterase/phospholipase RssA